MVGADVVKLDHEVLGGHIIVDSLNEMIIILIQKIKELSTCLTLGL